MAQARGTGGVVGVSEKPRQRTVREPRERERERPSTGGSTTTAPGQQTAAPAPSFSVSPELIEAIQGLSKQLLGTGEERAPELSAILGRAERLGGVADTFTDIGTGVTADPRFAGIREQTLAEQGEFLSRRGLGGSSAAANQLGRVSGALNLQELESRDRALAIGSQLGGQEAELLGAGLQAKTAGVETLSLLDQLKIAGLAAETAGKGGGDSGGGGGLFGGK